MLDDINHKADGITRAAERNNNRMQGYLERTSDCQLYLVIGLELLVFLILMSL
jgi:hypothetical protein